MSKEKLEIPESIIDAFGFEVKVGDTVVYTNYHKLSKGEVEKITRCGVTIKGSSGTNKSREKFAKL